MGYLIDEMNFDIKSGITGIPILFLSLIILIISIYNAIRILKYNDYGNLGLVAIWLLGLLAFIIRLIEQVLSLGNLLYAIGIAGSPDYQAFALGLSEITLKSVLSLTVLLMSLILWGILKGIIMLKINRRTG